MRARPSTLPATRSRAVWSPTSASWASARSTWCGCRGARSSRSSSRTPGAAVCSATATRSSCPGARSMRSCWIMPRTPRPVRRSTTSEPRPMSETVRKKGITGYFLLGPGMLWLLLFFLIPFYSLVAASLFNSGGSDFRGYTMVYEWSNYTEVLKAYWPQIVRSLVYGSIATLQCLILGYVLAYAIAFKAGRWKNLMLVLVIAPFFTSFLVRTLSWKLILADDGIVVDTLNALHIMDLLQFLNIIDGDRLLVTPVAVVAGLTYNFLPFMVLPLYASIDKIDHRLIEAAGDYNNGQLLGGPNQRMVGGVIQSLFTDANDYPSAAALSMILMIGIVGMVLIYVRKAGTEELL